MNKTGIKNLAPKIISILFALILWIYVIGTINPRTSANFPNVSVKLENIEDIKNQGFVLVGDEDFTARVRLLGRRDEVYSISPDQIELTADLRGYRLGANNIPIEVSVPGDVDVDVNPRYIEVNLEEIIEKQRDVKIITSGIPEEGFAVGELQYKPTVTWIKGPESYVNSVENVIAQLDITGASDELLLSLPLKPVNSRGEEVPNIDVETSYTDISLGINLLKTVPINPNYNISSAEDYEIMNVEVTPKEITLKGQRQIVNAISEISTELIELENISENKEILANLDLPDGVIVQNDTDIRLGINVEPVEERNFQISSNEIEFNNLSEDLEIDTSNIPENLDVTITAIRDVLDSLNTEDIRMVVDLNGLNADEYDIEPIIETSFNIKTDIKDIKVDPEVINIELKEE